MSRIGYGRRVDLIIGSVFFGCVVTFFNGCSEQYDYGVVTDTMDTFDLELLLLCCILVNNSMIFNEHYLPSLVDAGKCRNSPPTRLSDPPLPN